MRFELAFKLFRKWPIYSIFNTFIIPWWIIKHESLLHAALPIFQSGWFGKQFPQLLNTKSMTWIDYVILLQHTAVGSEQEKGQVEHPCTPPPLTGQALSTMFCHCWLTSLNSAWSKFHNTARWMRGVTSQVIIPSISVIHDIPLLHLKINENFKTQASSFCNMTKHHS